MRLEANQSLGDVSRRTGISKSFLSLLESGGSDISFGRLQLLLHAYGRTLGELQTGLDSGMADLVKVAWQEWRFLHRMAPGVDSFLTSRSPDDELLSTKVVFAAGAGMTDPSQHEGDEVFQVIEGEVDLILDDGAVIVSLARGDTAYVVGGRLHRVVNNAKIEAIVSTVVAQGSGHALSRTSLPRRNLH
jgi:quercetin dioxygenase-like cupin family protein